MECKDKFLQPINFIDIAIKVTVEDTRSDWSIAFLDTIITPEQDRILATELYKKKPAHIQTSTYSGTITIT